VEFAVFPFNEESDSLEYSWIMNNEAMDSDTSCVEIPFTEIGVFEISVYSREGAEADTVHWTVEVQERSSTDSSDFSDLPTSPVLYPPNPNPFNSSVRLSMYQPRKNHVSISIFDINGREVSQLVDEEIPAGGQTFVWNADDFPAGVYVVQMNSGSVSQIMKLVLVP